MFPHLNLPFQLPITTNPQFGFIGLRTKSKSMFKIICHQLGGYNFGCLINWLFLFCNWINVLAILMAILGCKA